MADVSQSSPADYALSRFGLVGKTALVTGGTKGIGRAIVEEFCQLGAKVYLCSRSERDVEAALEEGRARGWSVDGCACDVSKREECERLVAKVGEAFGGKLDILVNNVGSNVRKPSVEYSEADYQFVLSTNLESAYVLSQLCHPLLKAAGSRQAGVLGVAGWGGVTRAYVGVQD